MSCRSRSSHPFILGLLGLLILLFALPVRSTTAMPEAAVNYTVDTTTDAMLNSGCDDGVADADCSLRGAISLANSQPSGSVIHIGIPAGSYALATPGTGENGNLTGDLDVLGHEVTLEGAGHDLTILDGDLVDRVLDHDGGSLSLASLQITGGQAPGSPNGGGGILNRSGSLDLVDVLVQYNAVQVNTQWDQSYGGGIGNFGDLSIQDSEIAFNQACFGGGIATYADSTLTLNGTTVSDNNALDACFGQGGGLYLYAAISELSDTTLHSNHSSYGGGVYADYSTSLILNRVTLRTNSANYSGGGIANNGSLVLRNVTISGNTSGSGGGVANYETGDIRMNHCTLAANTAQNSGYAYYAEVSSKQTIHNTILASSSTNQKTCHYWTGSIFNDNGYNLSSDASCLLTAPKHDIFPVAPVGNPQLDPRLGPLAWNGGPTQTHALLLEDIGGPDSPAIDSGDPVYFLGRDQRGFYRPADGDGSGVGIADIGAYELGDLIFDQLLRLPLILRLP